MSAHYDSIVEQYVAYASRSPTRPIEARTMRLLSGPLRGHDVLDLACGSGYYGRDLLQHGARSATGVDQSPGMIRAARALSLRQGDGMTFVACDVLDMGALGQFDIVLAAWLFNYADSLDRLQAMCRAAFRHMKPAGRLVVQTFNPDYRLALGNYAPYGITVRSEEPWQEGARLLLAFNGEQPAEAFNYRWTRAQYEHAMAQAGFSRLRWHEPEVLPEDVARHEPGYWDNYVHNCMSVNLVCER